MLYRGFYDNNTPFYLPKSKARIIPFASCYNLSESDSQSSINSSSLLVLVSCSLESSCNSCIFVPLAGSESCKSISELRVSSFSISVSAFFNSFSILRCLACSSFCCCQSSLLPDLSWTFSLDSIEAAVSCAFSASSFFSR